MHTTLLTQAQFKPNCLIAKRFKINKADKKAASPIILAELYSREQKKYSIKIFLEKKNTGTNRFFPTLVISGSYLVKIIIFRKKTR